MREAAHSKEERKVCDEIRHPRAEADGNQVTGRPSRQAETTPYYGPVGLCVDCIGQFIQFQAELLAGKHPEDTDPPEINIGVTLAPSWQMKTIGGQTIMACVAVPACMDHLNAKPTTPLEKAVLGGHLLPGTPN